MVDGLYLGSGILFCRGQATVSRRRTSQWCKAPGNLHSTEFSTSNGALKGPLEKLLSWKYFLRVFHLIWVLLSDLLHILHPQSWNDLLKIWFNHLFSCHLWSYQAKRKTLGFIALAANQYSQHPKLWILKLIQGATDNLLFLTFNMVEMFPIWPHCIFHWNGVCMNFRISQPWQIWKTTKCSP